VKAGIIKVILQSQLEDGSGLVVATILHEKAGKLNGDDAGVWGGIEAVA
jgi:hypothetical protein